MTVTEFVIDDAVVAAVAARAALDTPGVLRMEPGLAGLVGALGRTARQRWKGLTPAPSDGVRVEIGEGAVSVRLEVTVSGQDQAAAVGQAVQRAVVRAVATATGLEVAKVSVSIVDIEP